MHAVENVSFLKCRLIFDKVLNKIKHNPLSLCLAMHSHKKAYI